MEEERSLVAFEEHSIRRIYDEKSETWFFSVVDVVAALIQQQDYQAARNYWKVLKNRLKREGSESVTKCNRLKMLAADGKKYFTDVASPETLLRIVQSVPSPKAEPIKVWLAKVGYERIQDMSDPARSVDRAREYWRQRRIRRHAEPAPQPVIFGGHRFWARAWASSDPHNRRVGKEWRCRPRNGIGRSPQWASPGRPNQRMTASGV